MDDNIIHQAIIRAHDKFAVALDYDGFSREISALHKLAFKQPGYALGVIEKLIQDNEDRLMAYTQPQQFFVNEPFIRERSVDLIPVPTLAHPLA